MTVASLRVVRSMVSLKKQVVNPCAPPFSIGALLPATGWWNANCAKCWM